MWHKQYGFERHVTLIKVGFRFWFEIGTGLKLDSGRHSGLMDSALDSGASGPGSSSPGRGRCVVFLGTTETGRQQIHTQEWQLILAPNVNDFGSVALFVKSKSWTHMVTFLSPWQLRRYSCRYSLLFTLRSFGVNHFHGSPKVFFYIPQWWSLKCFL